MAAGQVAVARGVEWRRNWAPAVGFRSWWLWRCSAESVRGDGAVCLTSPRPWLGSWRCWGTAGWLGWRAGDASGYWHGGGLCVNGWDDSSADAVFR